MVNSKLVKVALILIIGGIALYFFLQSEEGKIRKELNLLTELISREGEEPALILAQKARRTGLLFTETCDYESKSHSYSGHYTRQEIIRQTAAARSQFSSLKLKLYDLQIEFPTEKTAKVILTASVKGQTKAGEEVNDTHEIELTLKKIEKEWLINYVKVVEVLAK
ncbi:MAG: hypothetical protein IME96_09200 [Proteobacteria bacterium]|nr:hypothetical protein [Pseudomonadota bacterium]